MVTVSLRLSEEEHSLLREWAFGSRRSLQREIVFRLFDGAVTERGSSVRGGGLSDENEVGAGTRVESHLPSAAVPRSVTAAVVPDVHDVPVERSSSRNGCGFDTPKGTKCKLCGKVHP